MKNRERYEALAEGVARYMTIRAAAVAAGYSPKTNSVYNTTKKPQFVALVEKLRSERGWGDTPDLSPVINMMMRFAAKHGETAEAAMVTASTRLLIEAAKLKQLLPGARLFLALDTGAADETRSPQEAREWALRYVPPS